MTQSFLVYMHRRIAEATTCPAWLEETFWWNGKKGREECSTPKDVMWCMNTSAYIREKGGRSYYKELWKWLRSADIEDVEAGRDCLCWVSDATWWDWAGGSRPFFWRWETDSMIFGNYINKARDGAPIHVDRDALPLFRIPQ